MIMMAKTTKPTMKLITNEEGGEGETGGKTTQVRFHHKLRLHCLFDLGFGLFGRLAYLCTRRFANRAIPVIELSFDCMKNEEGGEGETGGKTTQVRDNHKLRLRHCLFDLDRVFDLGFGLFGRLAHLPGGLRSYPSHRGHLSEARPCLMGVLILR
jgi:hypothetical protein